ncbi:hypothetical protein M885DRAFT_515187 [Pelagophyceae sp. CCMP2097]|nr:hypothetical protein M885DRAFT_515187 [Pelagophyceae sp. CCMP2097]
MGRSLAMWLAALAPCGATPLIDSAGETCAWMSFIRATTPYTQCLRRKPDRASDTVRKSGASAECEALLKVWQAELQTVSEDDAVGSVFVDAGANIGMCSLLFAAHGIATVAIEPFRSNLFYLTSSVRKNAKIAEHLTLHAYVALTNETSWNKNVTWHVPSAQEKEQAAPPAAGPPRPGRGRPAPRAPPARVPRGKPVAVSHVATDFSVMPRRLDDVLSPPPRILLMKVGFYDPKLFLGAEKLFAARAIRTIAFEIGHNHMVRSGDSFVAILQLLISHGFAVTTAGRAATPVTPDSWGDFLRRARAQNGAQPRYDFFARLAIEPDAVDGAVWE